MSSIYQDRVSAKNSHSIVCLMMADDLPDDPEVLAEEASSEVREAANQILTECGGNVEAAFILAIKKWLGVGDEVVGEVDEVNEGQDMGFDEIPF